MPDRRCPSHQVTTIKKWSDNKDMKTTEEHTKKTKKKINSQLTQCEWIGKFVVADTIIIIIIYRIVDSILYIYFTVFYCVAYFLVFSHTHTHARIHHQTIDWDVKTKKKKNSESITISNGVYLANVVIALDKNVRKYILWHRHSVWCLLRLHKNYHHHNLKN